jgi:hypothetical protein
MAQLTDSVQAQIFGEGEPPNLRLADELGERCGTCVHYDAGQALCTLYGVNTREVEVCDAFEPRPGHAPVDEAEDGEPEVA